jgi:hypothetical protein
MPRQIPVSDHSINKEAEETHIYLVLCGFLFCASSSSALSSPPLPPTTSTITVVLQICSNYGITFILLRLLAVNTKSLRFIVPRQ